MTQKAEDNGILELGKLVAGYGMLLATFASADAYFEPDGMPDLTEELIATQRRWAALLNERDGGSRRPFANYREWHARMLELDGIEGGERGAGGRAVHGILELGKLVAGYGMLLATFASADAYLGDFEPDGMPDLTEELIATQRRWAALLNERDGGSRRPFANYREWHARMLELDRRKHA